MSHILVVGATGMLREATLQLAHLGMRISAIARTWENLNQLRIAASYSRGIINPIAIDYGDTTTLRAMLRYTMLEFGPIDSVIAWVRSDSPQTLRAIAHCLSMPGDLHPESHKNSSESTSSRCNFLHLLGSSTSNPLQAVSPISRELESLPHIHYRRAILGYKHENGDSRWLTNSEISEGVLAAIHSTDQTSIIGKLEPWSARPTG
ncbi:MAG TPA: hypothetical protein VG711_08325 [Phycisphaerales bacterium]|nr:hypothetical protein [Phycisphaerales bacterium]